MNRLFLLTEYPNDMLPMYAQGYSVCRFLIEQSGPRRFITFLEDYMKRPSWTENVQTHYGYDSLAQLQENWLSWVAKGSGPVETFVSARTKAVSSIASNSTRSVPAPTATPRRTVDSASSDSWYQRRREKTAMGQIGASTSVPPGPAKNPLGPPSVTGSGRYSVSQPQAEQKYGEGTPVGSSARSTPIYR